VQVAELCERFPLLTKHHHNMLYIVSLMPLVERGCYVRCVVSYVFLTKLIETPPDIGSFLDIKVCIMCRYNSVVTLSFLSVGSDQLIISSQRDAPLLL